MKITNAMETGADVSQWQIVNPALLESNLDYRDGIFGTWEFSITDTTKSTAINSVTLGPGDSDVILMSVTPGGAVESGNRTILMRILEIVDDGEARYFDLPLEFEIERDKPDKIEIIQVSSDLPLNPGDTRTMDFKVRNGNNIDLDLLLEADVSPGDWDVDIAGISYVSVKAFSDTTFSIEITAPSEIRDGEEAEILITAQPLDQDFDLEEFSIYQPVDISIECVEMPACLIQELKNPRTPTIVIGLLLVFLLGAAAMRGRRAPLKEYVDEEEFIDDELFDSEELEEEEEEIELLDDLDDFET